MKKRGAFTLVECIAALMVTTFVIILAGLAMTSVRKVNQHSLAGSVDWFICLQELESPDQTFALKKVYRYRLLLRDQRQQRNYELRISDRLYLRTPTGGYMPVLSAVRADKSFFRQLDQQRVYVEVGRTNGQKNYGIICFDKAE
ncbi:type IV pilus minor pilin ComGF family protein [Limosilactobacillus panis]|uniref:Type IV pilus minor pilin ComGF family protein n=1 Tax=Limosilactobacillus panis TaxID=47493 RepID=A0ABT7VM75_9LACO|nr:type IV pilus minor pilin ComGF family protein [Limosilactobacillus panis]MDM8333844.1 type IV pilus minor pilin ComGF family protein [Limosilactobacillus panis]HJA21406.1 hypothetical protein [Candidatus Limosilactobacillus intestinipullorum]